MADTLPTLPCDARLAAVPACMRLVLRGNADVAKLAGAALDVELPRQPNRAMHQGGQAALWLGPDEWLLLTEFDAASAIETRLAGQPHSLVDVSHRQIGIVLEGSASAQMLSAGCPLDLRTHRFPVGMATRTIFMKAEIVLWRQTETRFHIEIWRSFLPYLLDHFKKAANSVP